MESFDPRWYESFFGPDYLSLYAPRLDAEQTEAEIRFCVDVLGLSKGDRVLDLCCGTGRHTEALAKRGVRAVGLDLSSDYLAAARSRTGRGEKVEWVRADMRAVPFAGSFDAVINMFTAFGYFPTETEDGAVLASAASALASGGALLIDTLSRDWVAAHHEPEESRHLPDGTAVREVREFDAVTGRGHVRFVITPLKGEPRRVSHHIRLYVPTELAQMAEAAGLRVESWYGDYRGGGLDPGSMRLIMVARRL